MSADTSEGAADRAARHLQELRRRARGPGRQLQHRLVLGARARRRERRRQVDARQDPHRHRAAPTAAQILIDGQQVSITDPLSAYRLGLLAMYQEPTVFPDLSVAENVFAGRHPRSGARTVDWGEMQSKARAILDELGADFGPDRPVRGLGVADRQLLEIAKALSSDARLLIMDEPTAALSPPEVERLFKIMRGLRDRGVAIVFISHRLEEVTAISDTVTILRDGQHVATRETARAAAGRDDPADGRPLARAAVPEGGGRDRRRRRQGRGPRPPRRLRRRLVRAPPGRDRGPRRLRRLGAHRDRARHLRHRRARRRPRLDRRRSRSSRARRGRRCGAASPTYPRTV